MEASSITRPGPHVGAQVGLVAASLAVALYVGAAPVAMVVLIGYAIPRTTWYASDLRGQRPPRPPGGDKALRAVSDALRTHLRAYDLAGRFGGEEFALLLPHTREIDAISVAERLRAHVASMAIPVKDHDESAGHITLTISVGVAALDAPGRERPALDGSNRELADLLAAADAALYHAKETGRNRTHVIPAAAQAS